ncbi:MAG: polysaccharide pyruvyl transferase family protein [Planctomycetaceae bacterium]|nr:polysaccharide pyruvyl transferase family protein [Planctomycetaceae bacterium]
MKKIGILTYHAVCNFGANLQALSTVGYFRKKGYNPVAIDWVPEDMERQYRKAVSPEQFAEHQRFINEHLPLTQRCRTEQDILGQIKAHALDAIVIGSDAVTQHKSLWSRLYFPTKTIFRVAPPPPPQLVFPNPFWGSFMSRLETRIPIIMMSVSCQNEKYIGIQGGIRQQMYKAVKELAYISVRDHWTQRMFKHISRGRIIPPVTPDPVFSFNQNAGERIAAKDDLLRRFNLSPEYLLLSFVRHGCVDRDWLCDFAAIANCRNVECLMMPMPRGHIFNDIPGIRNIPLPLSPLDWYGLIKNSTAYIGHNMHPMIVAMHNDVPFYIFDYYGIVHLKLFVNSRSSKIYDILERAGMLGQRSPDTGAFRKPPKPREVFESVMRLRNDRAKQSTFSNAIVSDYQKMMTDIVSVIERGVVHS